MFLLANLILALAQILDYILWADMWILIARVVISFFDADYRNPIERYVYEATEPVLQPLRRRLPPYGGFDFSPLVAWLAIMFVDRFLVRSLYDLAYRMN